MARRELEAAIKAGQIIEQGKDYPDKFTRVCVDYEIQLEREIQGIYSLQYSFDGKLLAAGCDNGTIKLFETSTGRKLPDIRKSRYGGYPIMALRFHPKKENHILAATSQGQILDCDISDFIVDGCVDLSHIKSDKDERWLEVITEKKGPLRNEINCLDFNNTLLKFATAGKDLNVRVYDSNTYQLLTEFQGYDDKMVQSQVESGSTERVFALKFHPEYENILITGGWGRHIKVWNILREKDPVVNVIFGPHVCGDALDLRGFEILTGSWCGKDELQIWNYSTDYGPNSKAKPITLDFGAGGKGAFLYAAQFCDNDVVIAGGSGTNSAKAINTKTNEILGEVKFDSAVMSIDTVHGGRLFAVGDGKRTIKMCSLK